MNAYIWTIASLVLLIPVWILWSFLRVYFPAKALARLDEKINRTGQRLVDLAAREEAEANRRRRLSDLVPPFDDEDRDLKIYKDLVQKVNLQELWARARTRVIPGRKNNQKDADLMIKIVRLTSEIETFIQNEVTSRAMAQIGDWDDKKIAFFRNSGMKQRASIAAIDQLVSDVEHELRIHRGSSAEKNDSGEL
jgi:hypothetical protein